MMKKRPLEFLGSSAVDLRAFPKEVRQIAGSELLRVQLGVMPRDFKPMASVGKGVYEIRIHVRGAWRVMYVARFEAAIYVLHAFQKKTQRTAKADLEIAAKRYRSITEEK